MNSSLALVWKSTRKHKLFAVAFAALSLDGGAAGHVHGHWLGQVDVLSGRHGVGRLRRVEERRAFNGHGVERLLEQPAIA